MEAMSSIRVNGRPMSGHVYLVDRQRGPQWYVKYRLPDGRQVKKRLGPAWTGRGRPRAGYLTRRSAQEALDEILAQARAGTLPGLVRTGATFAMAAEEWLRFIETDRQRKRSTVRGYRSIVRSRLLPASATGRSSRSTREKSNGGDRISRPSVGSRTRASIDSSLLCTASSNGLAGYGDSRRT